ncbi:MAG: hypothetical protein WBC06_05345 [Chitinophagaceae bacterium]
MLKSITITIVFSFLLFTSILSQNNKANSSEIRININCKTNCDFQYLKTEITYVDFVPDRFLANVFIQITSQQTGSGGEEIKLFFAGQENFKDKDDTLEFIRSSVATEDEYRKELTRYLKLGLTSYIAKTSIASKINITAEVKNGETPLNDIRNKKDAWNSWVFNLGSSGSLNKDDYSKQYRYTFRIDANKVTDKFKISSGINYSKNRREIKLDDYDNVFINDNYGVYFNPVISLTDHWSYGFYSAYIHSTFSNYETQFLFQPALEYSIFPYKEAVKKSIKLFYQIGPSWNKYIDSSYYNNTRDRTFQHSLSLYANFVQKWGSLNGWASWNSYLNSFDLLGQKVKGKDVNNISVGGYLDFRIVKGLSLYISSYADFTKGIFPNIRKADFNSDDILANVRQYPTTNTINTAVGINYRFGSIYNNVVNPRFNRDGGGFIF